MRHRVFGKQLSRDTEHRKALRRNQAASLFEHGAIRTTAVKAKELRPFVEKLITRAKTDTVANRRIVSARIHDAAATKKLFTAIAPRYKGRTGGYVRIVKRTLRGANDARKLAYIAFV